MRSIRLVIHILPFSVLPFFLIGVLYPVDAVSACRLNSDCPGGVVGRAMQICSKEKNKCVYNICGKVTKQGYARVWKKCPENQRCEKFVGSNRSMRCVYRPKPPQCTKDGDCALGETCEVGKCVVDLGADRDRDGIPDGSIANPRDNCPALSNPGQQDTDGDGTGDACDQDVDNDGIVNRDDNCPLTVNQRQDDMDADGIGDACDDDIDGDGFENWRDRCPLQKARNQPHGCP